MHESARGIRSSVLTAAACMLASAIATGCASSPRAVSAPAMSFSCCAASVVAHPWRPGQQIRLAWTTQGRPAAGSTGETALTATLTGPYRTVVELKAANANGTDRARQIAAAPVIRVSGDPASAPVSVITIPADAAPGYYNLRFADTGGNMASYGATIISVG